MKLIFRIRFHTRLGQSLFLTGNHPIFGGGREENAISMNYRTPEFWEVEIELPTGSVSTESLTWGYLLKNPDGSKVWDWGNSRSMNPASFRQGQVLIIDSWNDMGVVENVFYTSPFRNVFLRSKHQKPSSPPVPGATHAFKIKAPTLAEGSALCIIGNCAPLGGWSTAAPLLLSRLEGEDSLVAQANLQDVPFPVGYKYGVYDLMNNRFIEYETGENRVLTDSPGHDSYTVVDDGFVRLPSKPWKAAGVAIPVFSLRSEKSFGAGEFSDLKLLADWCAATGLKLIQILPVNDTSATATWQDSYPYSAISAFALHPLYLNLSNLALGENPKLPKGLEQEQKRLNALDKMDYEAVMQAKMGFVRKIFPKQRDNAFGSPDYKRFFEQNRHWLLPYAVFCSLRDKYGTSNFNNWPAFRNYDVSEIAALLETDAELRCNVELNYFIQFHLHLQLKEARKYANSKGVIIKGDIAIGVNPHGADVWQQPELFHTGMQTGAPPDPFAAKGQNWGFPTYNWHRMEEDNYLWWQQRFEQMNHYFDAFRIDHILGFFRIWSTPSHAVEAILGYFDPAIPVRKEEFDQRGICFDHDRLVKPFISDPVLKDLFGGDYSLAMEKYIVSNWESKLALRPEFDTQAKVERHFASLEQNPQNQRLKEALFDLISNVILLEPENGNGHMFHFRFGADTTYSFKNLPQDIQFKVMQLYLDYFFSRQEELWRKVGLEKLPKLKRSTNMLICGEDLGMVPTCVPEVMKQLGLLSLEIQRMPKTLHTEFSSPSDALYLSVVTPSTHDMSTIRGWWEEDRPLTQKFYNNELGLPGFAPQDCDEAINRKIVEQHLASPAMWSIFQWQDLMGMDGALRRADIAAERINVPVVIKHYWRYRMHLSLEQLATIGNFNKKLKQLIAHWRP